MRSFSRALIAAASLMVPLFFAKASEEPTPVNSSQPAIYQHINELIETVTREETERKNEYYEATKHESWMRDITLEAFLGDTGRMPRWGEPESENTIQQLKELSPNSFPAALIDFYKTHGFVYGGEMLCTFHIFAPSLLVERHNATEKYRHLKSMGIADFIRHIWDNDRPEVGIGSEYYTDEQIRYLNDNYTAVGTFLRPEDGEESHDYIYFDKDGNFGIFYLHQDEMDMRPLLGKSPANKTWEEVLAQTIEKVESNYRAATEDD